MMGIQTQANYAPFNQNQARQTKIVIWPTQWRQNWKTLISKLLCVSSSSDDTPAPDNQDTFQALLDEHPQDPEDRKPFQNPKESSKFTPFQASFSDDSKSLRSFPLGSSGSPDGVTPQHLRDLIDNNADVMLLQTLTDFVTSSCMDPFQIMLKI